MTLLYIPPTVYSVSDQRSALHAESDGNSVPSVPPIHSYEEVNIDQPPLKQTETLYDEVVVTSHQQSGVV